MFNLLLGLMLVQSSVSADRYRLNDFYCYDQNGRLQVLKLQPKVLFFMDDNFKTLAEDIKIDFFRKVILFSKNDNLENVS
jgi:energy-converting hydrogenase A subunit M